MHKWGFAGAGRVYVHVNVCCSHCTVPVEECNMYTLPLYSACLGEQNVCLTNVQCLFGCAILTPYHCTLPVLDCNRYTLQLYSVCLEMQYVHFTIVQCLFGIAICTPYNCTVSVWKCSTYTLQSWWALLRLQDVYLAIAMRFWEQFHFNFRYSWLSIWGVMHAVLICACPMVSEK